MVTPKYDLNQTVFVYKNGKLVEKVISKIQILIAKDKSEVGYLFEEDKDESKFVLFSNIYLDESEVFQSLEHFVELNSTT